MVFGHLEVLHAEFQDRTISNLGDYVEQTDRQTNTHTDRQTDRQRSYYFRVRITFIVRYVSLYIPANENRKLELV